MSESPRSRTVEFAPIGIWKVDLNLLVIDANPAVGNQLNVPSQSVVGKRITDVLPFVGPELFATALKTGKSVGHKQQCPSMHPDKLLPTYWEVSVGPFRKAGEIAGFVLSTMEVTEKERLIQQRDDFAAALSHNLKTPLVGAERVLETLLDGTLGTLNEQQEELLSQLQKSNHDLLNMVQDLIEVYRYQTKAANLSFENISLEDAVQDCMSKFAAAAGAKNIQLLPLVHPRLPRISADRAAIGRLLANLIDNAIKFTNPGGIVEVGAVSQSDSIVLTVKDNGVGMTIGDPDKLFSRFWQGEGKTYPAVTGLGLYLCRQIVDAHSGHISVRSKPNQGTVFSVTLPVKPKQQTRLAAARAED